MYKLKTISKLLAFSLLLHPLGYAEAKNTTSSAISIKQNDEELSLLSTEVTGSSKLKASFKGESPFTDKTYTHSDDFAGMNIYNGIDVSKYDNGRSSGQILDWDSAKEAGVDFAFIRLGYRGYGKSGTLCSDPYFKTNIEGALEAGIKVGVYYFTEAITKAEAKEEAEYCIQKLQGYPISLPVVIDYEFPTDGKNPIGRMYNAKLSKSAATNNCISFCDTIKQAGYTPMIYANSNDLTNVINGNKLQKSYKIWLARYNTTTTVSGGYSGKYEFWQYTSSGSVDGIGNGNNNTDCNFWYTTEDINNLPAI